MMPENDKEVEVLYDHYKDTFSYLRGYIGRRDKYTIIIIATLVGLFFQINSPETTAELSTEYIKSVFGKEISVNLSFVNSALLFFLFLMTVKYFQLNLLIERQYPYLHKIESDLSAMLVNVKISRESTGYLDNYPLISMIIHRIYTVAFPITLVLAIGEKIRSEYLQYTLPFENWFFIFDAVLCALLVICTILYFSWINFRDSWTKWTIFKLLFKK